MKKADTMKDTDNILRLEAIRLVSKALDMLTRALDIIARDGDSQATPGDIIPETVIPQEPPSPQPDPEPQVQPTATPQRNPAPQVQSDSYRADAIRFNEQFLSDRYELRYNTMLKTTEFRPRRTDEGTKERGFDEGTKEQKNRPIGHFAG